jgi:hypothetical protein
MPYFQHAPQKNDHVSTTFVIVLLVILLFSCLTPVLNNDRLSVLVTWPVETPHLATRLTIKLHTRFTCPCTVLTPAQRIRVKARPVNAFL